MATGGFVHHPTAIQSTICSILRCMWRGFLARAQGRRKVRACACEGDAGDTAGFQRVCGPFVATYTGQLAGRLEKKDRKRTGGWQYN